MDGSAASFDESFRAEYSRVVRVVSPIVGSVEDAESVTQEAFVKAYTRWRRVGRYDRPGAWVQRVAIRDAVRFAERQRRPLPNPPVPGNPTDPIAHTLDLHAELRALPVQQRACVVLHYLADWPVADVAEALGCKEVTVRVHLHRARAALALALDLDAEETTDGH